jgi:hypothetical protein
MGARTYTDDELRSAIAQSRSWRGVLRLLGLSATSSASIRSVRRQADRLDLDRSHFTGQRRWTDNELTEAVAASHSWTQVADALGLAGGSSTTIMKGHAVRLGIDTAHFASGRVVRTDRETLEPQLAQLPRAGSLLAAAWFTLCGCDVAWPLEPCRYDLLVRRDGGFRRVQVKTGRQRANGTWVVSLSTGGRNRGTYDPDDIDEFFVIDGDGDYYLIPVAAVGGRHGIHAGAYADFKLSRELIAPA